jgi:hypothetical protein
VEIMGSIAIDQEKLVLSVKLESNYKYKVEGLEMLADNKLIRVRISAIVQELFNDGFDKIDFNNNLFEVIMVNNNGKFKLVLGTGQKYKLLTIYEKEFNTLCDAISQLLIDSIYIRPIRRNYIN